ncbi:MAG: RHS repeat protein, partial [Alphaproteobacteria bacterium]
MNCPSLLDFVFRRLLSAKKSKSTSFLHGVRRGLALALAFMSCFWMSQASALIPLEKTGYYWPEALTAKEWQDNDLSRVTRATPELVCRDIATQMALPYSPANKRTDVLSADVESGPDSLLCVVKLHRYFGPDSILAQDHDDYVSPSWRVLEARACGPHSKNARELLSNNQRSCRCDPGYEDDATHTACQANPALKAEVNMCLAGAKVGSPILPATGEKYRAEEDIADGGPSALSFARFYRSGWAADKERPATGMGAGWTHSHAMTLELTPAVKPTTISVVTAQGSARNFTRIGDAAGWRATDSADRLAPSTDGGWLYARADDDTTFAFDAAGRLESRIERDGRRTHYSRDNAGRLLTITNPFGRSLLLAYDAAGRIASVSAPGARVVTYGYDAAGRLVSVRHPDGRSRGFVYENAAFPNALTGLVDENGARFASFTYDAQGRA